MLLMSCKHPDIFKFVTKKSDLTKVTGANISSMLTNEFMKATLADEDFFCTFPVDFKLYEHDFTKSMPYNIIETHIFGEQTVQVMKIHAKELFDLIIEMAWKNGEPGLAFIDTIQDYCPEGVYEEYKPVSCNPCGEIWMQDFEACRLLALNLFNVVINHWQDNAKIDYEKLYEVAYIQQRLADDIVDLEITAIDKIINKVKSDKEDELTKGVELDLWNNVRKVAVNSRRTGCGFTALADMLAALGLKYDSDEAIKVIEKVMHTKLRAELDCTIDMAIQRGPFEGWTPNKEFDIVDKKLIGKNSFYKMLIEEFPEQSLKMFKYGRRNSSFSCVAPTGTVSIVALLDKYANTSAGIEPVFSCFYFRNKKVNAGDKDVRVDFTDQNGDSWMTYPVVMGGFREWIEKTNDKATIMGVENMPKEMIEELFKKSPYYGSCANDIDWEKRIEIQAIVQKYTTNAISSTLNLPNNVDKSVVSEIYMRAWKSGLKGVTVYRDGCRTGVMVKEKKEIFEYKDAVKRPKELDGDLNITTVKGVKYGVIIGLMNNYPYEIFGFNLPEEVKNPCSGKIVKVKKGHYDFKCDDGLLLKDIQDLAIHNDELVLTRLLSGMMRHGIDPKYISGQIDKCNLEIVSFGKAVSRVLSRYNKEVEELGEKCPDCSGKLIKQEGCSKCTNCSWSRC